MFFKFNSNEFKLIEIKANSRDLMLLEKCHKYMLKTPFSEWVFKNIYIYYI